MPETTRDNAQDAVNRALSSLPDDGMNRVPEREVSREDPARPSDEDTPLIADTDERRDCDDDE